MTWILGSKQTPAIPFAPYSYEESKADSTDISSTRLLEVGPQTEPAIYKMNGKFTTEHALAHDFLPTNSPAPLVKDSALELFKGLGSDKVQFYPTEIRCSDGVVNTFKVARSLVLRSCIDFEKSTGTWFGTYFSADSLEFLPDCLGDDHFVNEKDTGKIVVSDWLKCEIEKISKYAAHFYRPQDL